MKTSFVTAALAASVSVLMMSPAHAASADTARVSTHKLSIGMFPALRPLALVRAEHWLEDAGYQVEWHEFINGIPPESAAMAAGSIDLGEADTSGIEQVAARSPGVMWYIANGASNYVALVATKGPGHGTVKVLLGPTVLKTVSLAATRLSKRQVIAVATFPSARSGTLKVLVATSGKPVRIEGLGVATR